MSDEHQAATNPKAIDPAELADLKRAFPHLHLPIPIGTERKASEIAGIRYSVESVLSIGDPVHETITERALRNTGLIAAEQTYSDRAAWDFTRGVFWNDDPEGLLFQSGAEALPLAISVAGGINFLRAFKQAARLAKQPGTSFGTEDRLLIRSHFGDLQFLHAMASQDGEDPRQTLTWILEWAEFVYAVATRPELAELPVCEVPLSQVRRWFPKEARPVTELFGVCGVGKVQQRALASLLHLVQDSYASGHTARHGGDGRVREFHSYVHQDGGRHAQGDKLIDGCLEKTPGALQAVASCTAILQLYQRQDSWQNLMVLLRDQIFELTDYPSLSSAGAEFAAG
jgi:hypothetical protein